MKIRLYRAAVVPMLMCLVGGAVACGGTTSTVSKSTATGSPSPSVRSPVTFVGFWKIPNPYGQTVAISRSGGKYFLALNGAQPTTVPIVQGRLFVSKGMVIRQGVEQGGIEFAWRDGRVDWVLVYPGGLTESTALLRLTKSAYVTAVRSLRDETTRETTDFLAGIVQQWANAHYGTLPPSSQLHDGTAFAKFLVSGGKYSWPFNLFLQRPVGQSNSPGDFTYTVSGHNFRLIGHLSNGRTYLGEVSAPGR